MARAPAPAMLLLVAGGSMACTLALQLWLERRRRCFGVQRRAGQVAQTVPSATVPRTSWRAGDGRRLCHGRNVEPFVLSGVTLGKSTEWTDQYLEASVGDFKASAHVSELPSMDFVTKNFAYEVMPMREFLRRALRPEGDRRYYYYRSQHTKRNKPSSLEVLGPLAEDFSLPEDLLEGFSTHSTVLRIASAGLRMWLHYDICDNFLCCVRGRKRVILFPPTDVGRLYINGSSSLLGSQLQDGTASHLSRLWEEFPLAEDAWGRRREILLEEGDVLFIPAMWFHCTEACPLQGASGGLCISVNVFLLRPDLEALHDPKDVWANRELLPAQEALKAVDNKALPALRRLPAAHRSFYCRKAAAAFLAEAEAAEAELEAAVDRT